MSYNILIVDDSSVVRKVTRKALSMAELDIGEVHEAANGREALERLKEQWIDLVLLDINMPVMNGIEFMEEKQKDEEIKEIPVVVVSTEGSKERKARLEELNISAYIRKPVTPESLTRVIKDVLEGGYRYG